MKTFFYTALLVAGCALPLAPAFAFSNSPQGAVIVGGGEAPWFGGDAGTSANQSRFLSGQQSTDAPVYRRHVHTRRHVESDQ